MNLVKKTMLEGPYTLTPDKEGELNKNEFKFQFGSHMSSQINNVAQSTKLSANMGPMYTSYRHRLSGDSSDDFFNYKTE